MVRSYWLGEVLDSTPIATYTVIFIQIGQLFRKISTDKLFHTDRQTDRQTHRRTDAHKRAHTHTHTHTHAHTRTHSRPFQIPKLVKFDAGGSEYVAN